jgi:hypothetical protein
MPEFDRINEIVERVVSSELDRLFPTFRRDLVRHVLDELQPVLAMAPAEAPSTVLNFALSTLQRAGSQAELLTALLDGCGRFSARAALFVLRAQTAVGWQACGFTDNETLKNCAVNTAQGLSATVIDTRMPARGSCSAFDTRISAAQGEPSSGNAIVLPLAVREKVAGLIYADAGVETDGKLDTAALEIMVRTAGLWLEILALRKTTTAAAPVRPSAEAVAPPGVASVLQRAAAAAAGITPALAVSAAPSTPRPAAPVAPQLTPPVTPPPPELSAADQEVHAKAKRFAKLLVDEIKLYNKAKLAEGRQSKDIYERLKEDIEKSRGAYAKRYGQTAAATADYFHDALVRILADGDIALLGSSFPR